MAREETVHVTDDLDGTEATASLTFAVDDVEYSIDLKRRTRRSSTRCLRPTSTPPIRSASRGPRSAPGERRSGGDVHDRPCNSAGVGRGERLRGQQPRPDPAQGGRGLPDRPLSGWC